MIEKPYIDIELFPCAGGFAEGHRRAGIHFDLAIEWLENHCDSYEANIGYRPVQMDVRAFYELLQMGWRPPKPVRYLNADPPCTPWSRAGKRLGQEDPRDMLEATCRIIALLEPDLYLIGNVPGLDDSNNLHIVQRNIGALSKSGYCTADYARLDAANYGTPQHRIRPFWFGHKRGPCIQWPAPSHGDPALIKSNLTLPGVDELIPWVTCRQALGHLSPEEIGRPIKLRRRTQNSKQHGSVPERPARVIGTSNLSDGNVILGDAQPRAGKRGSPKNHGAPQGERVTDAEQPSPTVTGNPRSLVMEPLKLEDGVAKKGRKEDLRIKQGNRTGNLDRPSATVTAKPARKGAGAHSVFTIQPEEGRGSTLSRADHPAPTLLQNTHGNASILTGMVTLNDKHPPSDADRPSGTIAAKSRGNGANVVRTTAKHPASTPHQPANTVRASDGEGANRALEWPWDRPSTTVLADERLGPPGHHDENYSVLSVDGDGIVISELAATIIQGFPETWVFVGESKKKRWSQIGQAMPPPLAHAVARSVVEQIAKTPAQEIPALLSVLKGGGS